MNGYNTKRPGEEGVKIKESQSRVCRLKVLEQRI